MNELHIPDPGHNAIEKEGATCATELELSGNEETRARPFSTPPDPVCYTKEITPMKGSGRVFLPVDHSKGNLFQPRSRSWSCDEIGASL